MYNTQLILLFLDAEEARQFLRSYAEAPAVAVVSVCVVDTETNKIVEGTGTIQHYTIYSV